MWLRRWWTRSVEAVTRTRLNYTHLRPTRRSRRPAVGKQPAVPPGAAGAAGFSAGVPRRPACPRISAQPAAPAGPPLANSPPSRLVPPVPPALVLARSVVWVDTAVSGVRPGCWAWAGTVVPADTALRVRRCRRAGPIGGVGGHGGVGGAAGLLGVGGHGGAGGHGAAGTSVVHARRPEVGPPAGGARGQVSKVVRRADGPVLAVRPRVRRSFMPVGRRSDRPRAVHVAKYRR